MSQLVMVLEKRYNIWKFCDYESVGPDTDMFIIIYVLVISLI